MRWVCERNLSTQHLRMHPHHRPVLLKANSLGPGRPRRDVLVSPQHRFLISGWRAQLYFGESELLAPAR
ncbi:MAG: Hint domain-containing protein, partial [Marinibacterium sp.]|nr:Hint domain-containing protein [Marinibacterium sp.]